jgi:hypothetical protein
VLLEFDAVAEDDVLAGLENLLEAPLTDEQEALKIAHKDVIEKQHDSSPPVDSLLGKG